MVPGQALGGRAPWAQGSHPPAPHLLLEQGLDSVLPLPDALAQLCLLDELLRGGDEELLGEHRGCRLLSGPHTQTPARWDPSLPRSFGPAPRSSGVPARPLLLEHGQP